MAPGPDAIGGDGWNEPGVVGKFCELEAPVTYTAPDAGSHATPNGRSSSSPPRYVAYAIWSPATPVVSTFIRNAS